MNPFLKIFTLFSRLVLPRIIVVGFDVQDQHLSAVASVRKGDKITLLGSASVEIPDSTIQDGEIKDFTAIDKALDALAKKMPKNIFDTLKNETTFVISISPHHVYTETIILPFMNENDFAQAIRLRLETSLPWPVKESYLDWNRVTLKERGKIGVFLAGVAKSTIDSYLNIFLTRGWRVGACEFHILSLSKFMSIEKTPTLFILLDEDGIEFAAFYNGKIISHYLQKLRPKDIVQDVIVSKTNQITSFIDGNFGITLQKALVLQKNNVRAIDITVLNKTATLIPFEPFILDSKLEKDLFIAQGASQREYGAAEYFINLLPPASSGRYHENLLLKTTGLWIKILSVCVITLLLAFLSVFMFLSRQKLSLTVDNIKLKGELGTRLVIAQPLIDEAKIFNTFSHVLEGVVPLKSQIFKYVNVIEEQAKKSNMTVVGLQLNDSNVIKIIVRTAEPNALAFKEYLDVTKMFREVIIQENEVVGGKNNIHVTLQF